MRYRSLEWFAHAIRNAKKIATAVEALTWSFITETSKGCRLECRLADNHLAYVQFGIEIDLGDCCVGCFFGVETTFGLENHTKTTPASFSLLDDNEVARLVSAIGDLEY